MCPAGGDKLESLCVASVGSLTLESLAKGGARPRWDSSMQFYVRGVDRLCLTVMQRGYFRPNGELFYVGFIFILEV